MPSIRDGNFKCETVYFGSVKREPLSIVFYDKESEQLDRKSAISHYKTRIERRFNFSHKDSPPDILAENLLASYLDKQGSVYRIRVFLTYIASQLRFSTHFHDEGTGPVVEIPVSSSFKTCVIGFTRTRLFIEPVISSKS